MSNFLIWHKSDFATLTTNEIETLKNKMLKLPTMSMDIFNKVLDNIDEDYPFSLSPKLILTLLVLLPKMLFIDIMTEKTQMLINHLKHLHLGLSLTTNISENIATVKLYENYTVNSLLLHVTILSLWDIEDQLYRLWIEVNGVIHDHMPA